MITIAASRSLSAASVPYFLTARSYMVINIRDEPSSFESSNDLAIDISSSYIVR